LDFPGSRIAKHYFPVTKKATRVDPIKQGDQKRWYIVGLDQILVDIEVHASTAFAKGLGIVPGESIQLSETDCSNLLERIAAEGIQVSYAAGGTVANTLNNYTFLSGEPAVLLGAIESKLRLGEAAFHYVAQNPKSVDLTYLVPQDGRIGTAITFISPDGDRSFAVAPGISNEYGPEHLPQNVVNNASVVLASLYSLRNPSWPIAEATRSLMKIAKEASVPVAFGLGTASLVADKREEVKEILSDYVTIAAMNAQEAEALTGQGDVLLACQQALEWTDVVIITEGPRGLTMGGYVDQEHKRETKEEVRSKSITDYNRWEYSRLMQKADCRQPMKVFTHIHPYRGGPDLMSNTSGAGDAALAAILHDVTANQYHRATVPDSQKHAGGVPFLTYSSLSRNAQNGNRIAYEVLRGQSPRLDSTVGSDEPD
jgi:inosine kinase